MSWYFHDTKHNVIRAATPRVASTSQRRLYEFLGFPRLEIEDAAKKAAGGMPVIGVIRDPYARLISAYRRHKPGFIRDKFEEYTALRADWDRHVMPQTRVHTEDGVPVTHWMTFEELIAQAKFPHHNATPNAHLEKINIPPHTRNWIDWFYETYADDIALYHKMTAG